MFKLKTISAALLAASAIGAGGLVSAPAASALPQDCFALSDKAEALYYAWGYWEDYGFPALAHHFWVLAEQASAAATRCWDH